MICEDLKVKMNKTRRQRSIIKTLNDRFNQPVSPHSAEAGAQSQQKAEEGSCCACHQTCDVHTHTRAGQKTTNDTCVSAFDWNVKKVNSGWAFPLSAASSQHRPVSFDHTLVPPQWDTTFQTHAHTNVEMCLKCCSNGPRGVVEHKCSKTTAAAIFTCFGMRST